MPAYDYVNLIRCATTERIRARLARNGQTLAIATVSLIGTTGFPTRIVGLAVTLILTAAIVLGHDSSFE